MRQFYIKYHVQHFSCVYIDLGNRDRYQKHKLIFVDFMLRNTQDTKHSAFGTDFAHRMQLGEKVNSYN